MLTLDRPQTTTAKTYTDGYFDGSIGLPKQDNSDDYLTGYYDGLAKYMNW